MNEALAKLKMLPVIRAAALISQGKSKPRACELAGISVDTFDKKLAENPTIATDFLIEERGKLLQQYSELMSARAAMLTDFVKKAQDPDVSVKTKLSIDAHLRTMQESMELELSLVSDEPQSPGQGGAATATDAEKYVASMQGAKLRKATGKATVRETTIEFSLGDDASKEDEEITEGHILDSTE